MSVLSTGIGIGNIDNLGHGAGCVGECRFRHAYGQGEFPPPDAGASGKRQGALQPDIELGDVVFSRTSVGFDGLLNY